MKIEQLLNSLEGMSLDFLSTVLDTLPVEFTIIDADDKVLFWNRHGIRVFKRIDFWIDLPDGDAPRKLLIRYYAIRDEEGNYLGILETTINLTPFQEYSGEFRLSDLK
jgi:DUF438 domain-containing protein